MTFALAAVAGVVGNQLTGHLTPVPVTFAGLLVPGMVVTFLLERSASGRQSDEDQGTGTAGKRAGTWDLRGTQGAQFGDCNQQANYVGGQLGPDRRR